MVLHHMPSTYVRLRGGGGFYLKRNAKSIRHAIEKQITPLTDMFSVNSLEIRFRTAYFRTGTSASSNILLEYLPSV